MHACMHGLSDNIYMHRYIFVYKYRHHTADIAVGQAEAQSRPRGTLGCCMPTPVQVRRAEMHPQTRAGDA